MKQKKREWNADITDKKWIRNTDKSVLIKEQNQKCLHFFNPFKIPSSWHLR